MTVQPVGIQTAPAAMTETFVGAVTTAYTFVLSVAADAPVKMLARRTALNAGCAVGEIGRSTTTTLIDMSKSHLGGGLWTWTIEGSGV